MPIPAPEEFNLLIRCPSCGQRFKVADDLRDRMVECGGCENRFRIDSSVVVRGKKVYPGERHADSLLRYNRVPLPPDASVARVQSINYADAPDLAFLEPLAAQKVIAGISGVLLMIFVALLIIFGSTRGGILDGVIIEGRLLLACFGGLLGTGLLLYSNPKARRFVLIIGLSVTAVLSLMPFMIGSDSAAAKLKSSNASRGAQKIVPSQTKPSKEFIDREALRNRIGITPLDTENARLASEGSSRKALGIWLHQLRDSNRLLVKDYLIRVTDADPASHGYPRDGGDYLLVLSGVNESLDEMAVLSGVFGTIEKIHLELSIVEVTVNNATFVEGPIERLSKKDDPEFEALNKRELESIDLDRVKRAVQRLSGAEPKAYRSDITRRLIQLLGDDSVEFKSIICSALTVWADELGPASEVAYKVVERLVARNEPVPAEVIGLLTKEKNVKVLPIIESLWARDPIAWEGYYGDMGIVAEKTLLERFGSTSGTIRTSAVRILGRVGGPASLRELAGVVTADPELKVLVIQAQKSISKRLDD